MAVSRIPGPALFDNLTRNGVDISVETDLLYIDVNNKRIGINRNIPVVALDINGSVLFNNTLKIQGATVSTEITNENIALQPNGTGKVTISTLTAGRVLYAGSGGSIIDSANLSFDGINLTVSGITLTGSATANLGNISVSGNTIGSSNTNGNINLTPNGTGNVIISTSTANRVFYSGTNKELITNANLTFTGTQLTVTGTANVTTLNAGNIQASGNTVTSSNTNGNITLSPNGTGNVILNTSTANSVIFSGSNKELLTDSDLTFDGTELKIANISIGNNTIVSNTTNSNINLDPNGTGRVVIVGTNALTVPVGQISERPSGVKGDLRYNSSSNTIEFFNGLAWFSLSTTNTIGSDVFNGDGSTVQFTLSENATSTGTILTLNGLVQSPGNAYTVTGNILLFTEAPAVGDRIEVRYLTDYQVVSTLVDPIPDTPTSSGANGIKGQIKYDSSYVYICVATNTWIRAAIDNSF